MIMIPSISMIMIDHHTISIMYMTTIYTISIYMYMIYNMVASLDGTYLK